MIYKECEVMIYKLNKDEVVRCNFCLKNCTYYTIWEEYEEEVSICGMYKESKSKKVIQSDCCNYPTFVWNTVEDSETNKIYE